MAKLQTDIQKEINKLFNSDERVELFKIDGSAFGGQTFYFTNNPSAMGGGVGFAGLTYQAIPIIAEGFDVTSSGTLAKPTLTVGNVSKVLLASMLQYGDMVGWKLTRIQTFGKFLDAGTNPNPLAKIGPEEWIVEKLVSRSASGIQWQLTTSVDRMGFKTGRQILKDKSSKNLYAPGVSRTRVR